MNSIDKLIKVLGEETDNCKAINKKYSVCNAYINACFTAGSSAVRMITVNTTGGLTVTSTFDWTFDKCMEEKGCKESTLKDIQVGTPVNPGGGNGGFRPAGRGNGAKPPTPLNPNDNTRQRIERSKRLCEITKEKLDRQYSLAYSREEELFKGGCDRYIPTGNTANHEKQRVKKLKDKLKTIDTTYSEKMTTLLNSSTCSGT